MPTGEVGLAHRCISKHFSRVAYRNEDGHPWALPVVKAVEQQMASDETLNKEYLPQEGMKSFSEAAMRLVLGNASEALVQNRVSHQVFVTYDTSPSSTFECPVHL